MPSVTEEIFRLKYEAVGDREIGRLREEIAQTDKHISKMGEAVKNGSLGMEAYSQAVKKAAKELAPLKAELAGYERAAERAAAASKAAGNATEDASAKAKVSQQGFANAGNAVFQMANLMEDAQFGARGLANNIGMLAGSLSNFHPIAMAVGGVLQILTAVFKDQIDAVLAQAGILDENLVKGMNKAKDATEGLADAQKNLLATMPNVTVGIRDQVQQIGELMKALDGTQARRLMEQGALDETGYRSRDLSDALKQVQAMREEVRKVDVPGPERDRQVAERTTWLRAAEKKLAEITADRQQFAQDRVARQIAAAGSSDEAALAQAQRLRNLSEKTGNEDLANMAGALERLTQTFRDFEAQAQQQAVDARGRIQKQERDRQLVEALIAQGEENKEASDRLVEQQRAADQAARDAAQQAAAAPVLAGAEASMMADLMGGKDPAQAADELMQQLRQLGYTIEQAFSMAAQVTAEVNQRAQQNIRAEALRNFRNMQMQNPFFNNRPNGF